MKTTVQQTLCAVVSTVPHSACHSSPCLNGGTCLDSSNTADVAFNANGYKCLCVEGFKGINCEGWCTCADGTSFRFHYLRVDNGL